MSLSTEKHGKAPVVPSRWSRRSGSARTVSTDSPLFAVTSFMLKERILTPPPVAGGRSTALLVLALQGPPNASSRSPAPSDRHRADRHTKPPCTLQQPAPSAACLLLAWRSACVRVTRASVAEQSMRWRYEHPPAHRQVARGTFPAYSVGDVTQQVILSQRYSRPARQIRPLCSGSA